MKRISAFFALLTTVCPAVSGEWIAVVPSGLTQETEPLAAARRAEGWTVTVLPAGIDAAPVKEKIAALAAKAAGAVCVVLVGDFGPEGSEFSVPPGKGEQLRMKGLPTDLTWAAAPNVEVGRLPARNAAEAKVMVEKILAWPRRAAAAGPFPAARFLAGHHAAPPAFEKIADGLTNTLAQRVAGQLPAAWRLDAAVHIDGSYWQVSGNDVSSSARRMMSSPGTIFAYMGHSSPFAAVSKTAVLLSTPDWRKLPADSPRPGLFFSCGCHACELGVPDEPYAFAAVRAPGGPPAVIGTHGVSWAAMGYLSMSGLIARLAGEPAPVRVGELWSGARQGLEKGEISAAEFAMLDMADGTSGKVPLDQQRREHLEMWMLLGDPAMPLLPQPAEIKIHASSAPAAGKPLTVTGTLPDKFSGGSVRVTLERHPSVMPGDLPAVPAAGPERQKAARERARRAGDVVFAATEVKAEGGKFTAILTLPAAPPEKPWTVRAQAGEAGGVLQIK